MYQYDKHDQLIIEERVHQYRDQTRRYLTGELSEDEFLPLRLQNGLYVQRLAPMLRIAVPYGMLNSGQLRRLAHVTRTYDKGVAHFTTRQNLQLNWPTIEDSPQILAELAEVQMHAVQTSGNCIRNTTTDQYAGVTPEELVDPRPYCEIIRQWSTFHPEFAFLPRKFKIAVNACEGVDRAATQVHDIGIHIVRNDAGELGYRVIVGGGLGRTPMVGSVIREFLPELDLLTYLDAVLRVYNRLGRRDNKYKARIKILVKALGPEAFAEKVEAEWAHFCDSDGRLTRAEIDRVSSYFVDPEYDDLASRAGDLQATLDERVAANKVFGNWLRRNTADHKTPGYRIVTLSLKKVGVPPGNISDAQMDALAGIADDYSFGEVRVTHEQNVTLADVRIDRLFELWEQIKSLGFATPTLGTLADIICCPGGDYCALANAKSIPVAEAIQVEFDDLDYLYDLGDLDLNISGCMNACGHHHVGNIGILGVDKKGEEWYQISLGGQTGPKTTLAKILGPSFARADVPSVVRKIVDVFVEQRHPEEPFSDTYSRIGIDLFKERVYAKAD